MASLREPDLAPAGGEIIAPAIIVAAVPSPPRAKRCRACKASKPLSAFAPYPRARDGHRAACKSCVRTGSAISPPMTPAQAERAKARAARPEQRARNRQAVASWRHRNPAAERARAAVRRARSKGILTPAPCCQIADCMEARVVAHHHDYGAPLDVLHVCRRHHALLHSGVDLPLKPNVPAKLKRLPHATRRAA